MDEIDVIEQKLLRDIDGQILVCNAVLKEIHDLNKEYEDLQKFNNAKEISVEIIE